MMKKARPGDLGLCVFPSIRVPIVLREWMARGLSVVTQRRPEAEWLLAHERNCLLAEPTPTALCEQLHRLVQDTDLRKAIASEAAQVAISDREEVIRDVHAYLHQIAVEGKSDATHQPDLEVSEPLGS
jgi:hypothetical protein